MNFLNNLSDKKYAKYKNRLHYVYAQLYRTQIYKEYLIYKKHKNFQINDGILKINNLLKKINKYSKDTPKIVEEISKITNKNQKSFLIYLFLKIFNSWKFLKNHGFILSHLSKYLYNISLTRVWQVKKKKYSNYIKTSFGTLKYTRRYFISKGFPMKTSDDVRCWLFYFKKIGKTNTSLQFYKKEFIFYDMKSNKNFIENWVTKYIKKDNYFKNINLYKFNQYYSILSSFWFFFSSVSNSYKNKNIFFNFLFLFYNLIQKYGEELFKIKRKDVIRMHIEKGNISKNLVESFIKKETQDIKKKLLSNLFSENKITNDISYNVN